jgi:hypothetical protein
VVVKLEPVGSSEQIRDAVEVFNSAMPAWAYGRKLLRSTSYWIYDPLDELFAPSKFAGFGGLTPATYDAATNGDFDGVPFDGHISKEAIERVLGATFWESDDLAERLVPWAEGLVDERIFEGIDRSKWRFVALPVPASLPRPRAGRGPRVWAFFANPSVYRIEEAIRARKEDTWVTAGREIHRGDRAIIWRGRAPDGRRGVVAFGDVVSEPIDVDDSENPFWVDRPKPKVEPRVRVRYVVSRGLPVWLDEHEGVLGQLSISRAKGGTVFNVTEEQWDAVVELAGGLPVDVPRANRSLGRPYTDVGKLSPASPREPFETDPDKVDRGNQGHADTQDGLARFLRDSGIEPLAPAADDPEFDLAWDHDGIVHVAEVKSITDANEETQLRLGLGQVLRYRHSLASRGRKVVAVLVPERRPADESWLVLCRDLGVVLAWPGMFDRIARTTT